MKARSRSFIIRKLKSLPGWRYVSREKALAKEFVTAGFVAAARLVMKIAVLAEKADHHPDVHLTRYKRLKVVLTTHSAGGVTAKDFALAKKIETDAKLAQKKMEREARQAEKKAAKRQKELEKAAKKAQKDAEKQAKKLKKAMSS